MAKQNGKNKTENKRLINNKIKMTEISKPDEKLHFAIKRGDKFDEIQEIGFSTVNLLGNGGLTPFHLAAINKRPDLVEAMLKESGLEINKKSDCPKQNTCLHFAVTTDYWSVDKIELEFDRKKNQIVKRLTENINIDIGIKNSDDETALQIAINLNNTEAISCLLHRDDNKNTPLHLAILNEETIDEKNQIFRQYANDENSDGLTPLHLAAIKNQPKVVEILLKVDSIKINHISSIAMKTSLHFAAMFGNEQIVKLLLDKEADFRIKDSNGKTPLALSKPKFKNMLLLLFMKETETQRYTTDLGEKIHCLIDYTKNEDNEEEEDADEDDKKEKQETEELKPRGERDLQRAIAALCNCDDYKSDKHKEHLSIFEKQNCYQNPILESCFDLVLFDSCKALLQRGATFEFNENLKFTINNGAGKFIKNYPKVDPRKHPEITMALFEAARKGKMEVLFLRTVAYYRTTYMQDILHLFCQCQTETGSDHNEHTKILNQRYSVEGSQMGCGRFEEYADDDSNGISILERDILENYFENIEVLIQKGSRLYSNTLHKIILADDNDKKNRLGSGAAYDKILQHFPNLRNYINVQNSDGYSPLHLAVIHNRNEALEFILKKKKVPTATLR